MHPPLTNCFLPDTNIRIAYCEARGSYTLLHFNEGQQGIVSYRLCLVEKLLNNENLIRCHKSYLVNIHFIQEVCIKRRVFLLQNRKEISISRRMMKKVIVQLLQKNN